MDATLETRLREMLDRQVIWQVMLRYARGLDRMDREMARSCYFDDAIEDHGRFVGWPEDFLDYTDRIAQMYRSTQHSLTNHFCDLQGDEAFCETYYIFIGVAETPPHLLSSGRYIDHFQRRDGEWRIANRVTVVESSCDLPDAAAVAGLPPAYAPGEASPTTRDRNDISYHRPPVPRRPRP